MRSTLLLLVCFLVLAEQASCRPNRHEERGMVEQTKAVNRGEDSMEEDEDELTNHELKILNRGTPSNSKESSEEDENGDDVTGNEELRILNRENLSAVNDGEDSMEDEDGDDLTEHEERRKMRKLTGYKIKTTFRKLDHDGNHFLDRGEVGELNRFLPEVYLPSFYFMPMADVNKDNKISILEFARAVIKIAASRG